MRLFVFSLLATIATTAFTQDSLTVTMLIPDKAIKISPLHLMNFYPTIEVSYEQKVLPAVTLQLELGYVLDYGDRRNGEFADMRGIKTKLEGRYYFWGRTDRMKMYYLSLEPYVNVINFDRLDSRRECFDLECNHVYTREYFYKMEYREQGVSIKAGLIRYYGPKFFFDINSGFTFRNIQYTEPDNLIREFDDWAFAEVPNEDDRVAISPSLGVRLGYRLK